MIDYINIVKVLSALAFVFYSLRNYFALKCKSTIYLHHILFQAVGLVTYLTLQFKLI